METEDIGTKLNKLIRKYEDRGDKPNFMRKKLTRCTAAQIKGLIEYMSRNRSFANSEYTGYVGQKAHLQEWKTVGAMLKTVGPEKSVPQWRHTWRDVKKRAREEAANRAQAHLSGGPVPELSKQASQVLSIIGLDSVFGIPFPTAEDSESEESRKHLFPLPLSTTMTVCEDPKPRGKHASNLLSHYMRHPEELATITSQHQSETASRTSKRKGTLGYNYKIVKKRCVELVKSGFPAAIIDDEAFQGILKLIPLSEESRSELTAEFIQKLVADNEPDQDPEESHADEEYDDDDPLQGNDDDDDEEQETSTPAASRRPVKVEIETGEECTCAQKDVDAHELDCPMASKLLPFLNYYELFMDEAKCTLCRASITWAEVAELKEHLDKRHPNIRYEDNAPPDRPELDSDQSYFEETRLGSKPGREKKEKQSRYSVFEERGAEESPPRKRARFTDVTLKNSEKISMEQFRLLDRFGLYVAALLESLPRDKCLKYQQHIVERLLKEQAAAG